MHGRNTEVRSYIMLRDAPDNFRSVFHQVQVTLPGRIADKRKEMIHVGEGPFKQIINHLLPLGRLPEQILQKVLHIFFLHPPYNGWFQYFKGNRAGCSFFHAFDGGHRLVFKEKLEGYVLPVFVIPRTDTTFLNEKEPVRDSSFPQEHMLCRNLQLTE